MKRIWIILAGIVMLAGCASPRLTNSEMVTLVEQFIADESLERDRSISAFSLDTYAELSDEYLIFRSAPSRYYLVKLVPRCSDIAYSPGLVLFRRFGNTLNEGTDYVYTPDMLPFKCFINKIYPLTRAQHDALKDKIKTEVKELELQEQQAAEEATPQAQTK